MALVPDAGDVPNLVIAFGRYQKRGKKERRGKKNSTSIHPGFIDMWFEGHFRGGRKNLEVGLC